MTSQEEKPKDSHHLARERAFWEEQESFEWLSEESIREVIAAIPIRGDVLEVCSGSGMFTKRIARSWSTFTCLDLSQRLLDRLARECPGVKTVQGDAQSPELPSSSFDTVLVFAGLHHLPDPELAISSMYELLRPGGLIAVFEPNDACWFRKPILAVNRILKLLNYTQDERFLRPESIAEAMAAAGLGDVSVSYMTPTYNPEHLRTPLNTLLSQMMSLVARVSSSATWQSFFIMTGRKPQSGGQDT